jgi:hypothetical protein
VDLENLTAYTVTIDATAAGDYHTSLIQIPVPAPDGTNVLGLPGNTVTSGAVGAYPSTPPLAIGVSQPPEPQTPVYDIALTLVDVTNGAGQIPANVAADQSPDNMEVVFLRTTLPSAPAPTSATLQYRLAYQTPASCQPPETCPPPEDAVPLLNWTSGDNHFEVMVDVRTNGHVQTLTVFGEAGLSPPVQITDVSVAMGASTLITVSITGADASSPAILLACNGGKHVSASAVPALTPRPLAFLLVAVLIVGVVSIGLVNKRSVIARHRF